MRLERNAEQAVAFLAGAEVDQPGGGVWVDMVAVRLSVALALHRPSFRLPTLPALLDCGHNTNSFAPEVGTECVRDDDPVLQCLVLPFSVLARRRRRWCRARR